jgi:hypothetical protein
VCVRRLVGSTTEKQQQQQRSFWYRDSIKKQKMRNDRAEEEK